MRILLLGKDGQVGWELQRSLQCLGEVTALGRFGDNVWVGDLSDIQGIRHTVYTLKPDVVVNAAAYTAVDRAENDKVLAHRINAEAVGALAEAVAEIGGRMVHYSTDYVFSGQGNLPWKEEDTPAPINVYGQSKLEGELAIQRSGCQHLIFRTSWVYGIRGNNFAKTILRLAAERESIKVVSDQVGAPTGAELIADISAHALGVLMSKPSVSGTYHLAAKGEVSWFDYARYVIGESRIRGAEFKIKKIEAIATSEYQTPAMRPLNSRIKTSKLQGAFNVALPSWQFGVDRMLSEIQGL